MAEQDLPRAASGEATPPDAEATADSAAVAAEDVEATVTELRSRVTQLEDQWRRAVADLDNFRKRTSREQEGQRAAERARVAAEWLPVVDNLDLALEHAGADPESIVDGVRSVRDQALAVLARLGFPRQADVGTAFDPARHEAVATRADDAVPEGTVIGVVRPGYGDDAHQLRPAAVVVATRGD